MDFLKWLLRAGFFIALMFLGLSAEPQRDNSGDDSAQKPAEYLQMIF